MHLLRPPSRAGGDPTCDPVRSSALTEDRMSKKTAKRKLRSRRKKANHGKRPNSGRR
jgi:hypothetical protein